MRELKTFLNAKKWLILHIYQEDFDR